MAGANAGVVGGLVTGVVLVGVGTYGTVVFYGTDVVAGVYLSGIGLGGKFVAG